LLNASQRFEDGRDSLSTAREAEFALPSQALIRENQQTSSYTNGLIWCDKMKRLVIFFMRDREPQGSAWCICNYLNLLSFYADTEFRYGSRIPNGADESDSSLTSV